MKRVMIETSLIGCVDGCIHRLPNTEKESIRKNDRYGYESYRLIEITPHCSKSAECTTRRQEIYARADASRESAKSAKQAHKQWERIASEYTKLPCPFFESVNN